VPATSRSTDTSVTVTNASCDNTVTIQRFRASSSALPGLHARRGSVFSDHPLDGVDAISMCGPKADIIALPPPSRTRSNSMCCPPEMDTKCTNLEF
jgi:hypothetical protein